jgi:small subunit ribosomal protein S6
MNKYEAMFIVKPDLSEEERKILFQQVADAVTKNHGSVTNAAVWQERKKMFFPLKRHHEGLYYLMNFSAASAAVKDISHAYKLNENILRVLISRLG